MKPLTSRLPILILAALLALILVPHPVAAQNQPDGLLLEAAAGFDGAYRDDAWLPINVRAANEGPDIEGELRVVVAGSGIDNTVYSSPISLPTRSDKRATLYIQLQNIVSRVNVQLLDDRGRLLAEVETDRLDRLTPDETLYGVISPEPGIWTIIEQANPRGINAALAQLQIETLPDNAAALDALDVLILSNVDSARLSLAQLEAIRAWIHLGGELVLTGGNAWQETTAPFSEQLPVTIDGIDSVPDLPALTAQFGQPLRDPGPYLVTQSTLRSGGELLLREGEIPLLARRPVGRGAVNFLALDPALAPLLDWRGSPQLWTLIGENAPRDPIWANGPQNPYSASSALSGLPALALPAAAALICFLGLYILIVGPLNYLVLRRVGRRELAWLTIPATVLIFSGLAYVGGFRLRGNDVILNQVSVVYGSLQGDYSRNTTLLGIFSPHRAAYDVHMPPGLLVHPFNREFGDMSGTGSESAIIQGSDTVLQGVRVDVSGMETYVIDHHAPLPPITGSATLSLDGSNSAVDVTLQNNSDLTLQNAGIIVGTSFIELGEITPGQRLQRDHPLLTTGSSATFGSGATFSGPMPGNQHLSVHYEKILGTTDFYSDREIQARFQLLESLQNFSGPSPVSPTARPLARETLTFIAWSQQPQANITIPALGNRVQTQATTLYLLELPIANIAALGSNVRVPNAMLDWEVDSPDGLFISRIDNFHLPPGRVNITFTPWPTFQQMEVTAMQLNIATSDATAPFPDISLWDWQQEVWSPLPSSATWGNINIAAHDDYIGPQNSVRVRLDNSVTQTGVTIESVYPILTGDIQ